MNNTVTVWSAGQSVLTIIGVAQGLFSGVNNLLLFATILYQKELRTKKENVVIFCVALADCLQGCGQVAMYSSFVLKWYTGNETIRQECLRMGVPVFTVLTLTLQATMLVFQSIDRLLAISKPLYYYGVAVSLPWRMCFAGFVYSMGQTVALVWLSLDKNDTASFSNLPCIPQTSLKPSLFAFWSTNHIVLGTISVLLFGLVMVFYHRHMNTVAPDTQRELQSHIATQRRVTMSMAWSCAATLALFVAPRIINMVMITFTTNGLVIQLARLFAFLTYGANSILNFFIYLKRHENIRTGFKMMLICEQLPSAQGGNVGMKQANASMMRRGTEAKTKQSNVGMYKRQSVMNVPQQSNVGMYKRQSVMNVPHGQRSQQMDGKRAMVRFSSATTLL